eukprot:9100059-Alexandrium_andersonii.AAC.1
MALDAYWAAARHGRCRLGAAVVRGGASAPGPFDSAAGNGRKRFGPRRADAAREPFAAGLPPGCGWGYPHGLSGCSAGDLRAAHGESAQCD